MFASNAYPFTAIDGYSGNQLVVGVNHRLNYNNNNNNIIIIKSMVLTKFFAVTWLSPITKPKHTVTLIQVKCRNERQRIWTILTLSIIFTTTTHR